jgi:hypothetical protein
VTSLLESSTPTPLGRAVKRDPRSLPLPPIDDGKVTRLDIHGSIIHEYERAA